MQDHPRTKGHFSKSNTKYYSVDVASYDGLQSTFAEIAETFGCIQCLVNAAGVGTGGPFLECGKAVIDKILDVNVSNICMSHKSLWTYS